MKFDQLGPLDVHHRDTIDFPLLEYYDDQISSSECMEIHSVDERHETHVDLSSRSSP